MPSEICGNYTLLYQYEPDGSIGSVLVSPDGPVFTDATALEDARAWAKQHSRDRDGPGDIDVSPDHDPDGPAPRISL